MRRFVMIGFAVGLALTAVAQSRTYFKTETQTLSASAPTLATDGVDVTDAQGYCVTLKTASAAQPVVSGSMLCYGYSCVAANKDGTCATYGWGRCPTLLDYTPGTTGQYPTSGDFEVLAGVKRVAYRTSSIVGSDAGSVDVTYTVRVRK